jgi:PRTRC genetic system protein E
MNLFQKFAASAAAGVVFHLTIRSAGNEMRLDILPETNSGKTGILIPPQALIATPEELDANVPGFLDTYLASTKNLNDQITAANAVMAQAEADAKVAVQKAATPKTASVPKPASTTTPPKKSREVKLLDDEADDEPTVEGSASSDGDGQTSSSDNDEDDVSATAPAGTPAIPASLFM